MQKNQFQKIAINIKTSRRAKRISVTIKPGGRVVATKPVWASDASVFGFLRSKRKWIQSAVGRMSKKKVIPLSGRGNYAHYKETARELVKRKIELVNRFYGFKFGAIRIKDLASRWGSCSSKSNLNFNYRIALLPDNLAEYVVAHELCHIKELNHSRAFWDLLALSVPDHRARRRELRNVTFA